MCHRVQAHVHVLNRCIVNIGSISISRSSSAFRAAPRMHVCYRIKLAPRLAATGSPDAQTDIDSYNGVRLRKDGLILTYSPCNRPGDDGCNECLTARRLMRIHTHRPFAQGTRPIRGSNNYRYRAKVRERERYFIIARARAHF